jgi:G3E family GTPase
MLKKSMEEDEEEKEDQEVGTSSSNVKMKETQKQQQQQSQQQQQIFRVKGVISASFQDNDYDDEDISTKMKYEIKAADNQSLDQRRFIVQAVHDLWEVHPASDELMWTIKEERVCKLVIIGKYLMESELRYGFENCFLPLSASSSLSPSG